MANILPTIQHLQKTCIKSSTRPANIKFYFPTHFFLPLHQNNRNPKISKRIIQKAAPKRRTRGGALGGPLRVRSLPPSRAQSADACATLSKAKEKAARPFIVKFTSQRSGAEFARVRSAQRLRPSRNKRCAPGVIALGRNRRFPRVFPLARAPTVDRPPEIYGSGRGGGAPRRIHRLPVAGLRPAEA